MAPESKNMQVIDAVQVTMLDTPVPTVSDQGILKGEVSLYC